MILFGEESLRSAVQNFVAHYHGERHHQSLATNSSAQKRPPRKRRRGPAPAAPGWHAGLLLPGRADVTAVRVRQPVARENLARIRVGHARFSGPIRNERARLCPPKLGQRQTSEVLADSPASTPPRNGRRKARVEFSVHTRSAIIWRAKSGSLRWPLERNSSGFTFLPVSGLA
jgi:hypothetical protein